MNDFNDNPPSAHSDILAIFSVFRDKRLKFYEKIIQEVDEFEDWYIPVERLLAYYISLRNLKDYGNDLKMKVQGEINQLIDTDDAFN